MRQFRHLHKLDQKGFHHYILPLLVFVILFGVGGAYFYLTSNAAATYVDLHIGSQNGSCVDGASIGGCTTSGSGAWQTLQGSNFAIKSQAGVCLDDWNGKVGTNAATRVYVHYYSCNGDRNQQWNWSGHRLVNVASRGCINGLGGGTGSGTQLIVYGCNSQANEAFYESSISTSTGGGGNGGGSEQQALCKQFGYPSGQAKCNNIGTALNFVGSAGSGYQSWANTTQDECLGELWNKESGWNNLIMNAAGENSSLNGAFGIAQALGHGGQGTSAKTAVHFLDGTIITGYVNQYPSYNANAGGALYQVIWGLSYIKSTYGNPCGAWAQEQHGGYYILVHGVKA